MLDRLAEVSPRGLRKTLLDGLAYAMADGQGHVVARGRIGFQSNYRNLLNLSHLQYKRRRIQAIRRTP